MTRQRAPKARILTASILFIAVITVLIAFATSAQQRATGQPSAKSSAASLPSIPAQGLLSRPPLGAVSAQSIPPAKLQGDKAVLASPDSGNPLFLAPVLYGSGGDRYVAVWYASIAVADVNGDGKLDLVVANVGGNGSEDGSVGVLLGNGDGTFQPAVAYDSGGGLTAAVAVADVNGDGKPDVITANAFPGTVGVLLGNGDGTLQPSLTIDFGGAVSVAVADVNGDGKPDLLVANFYGSVGVMPGNGDGTFQPPVMYTGSPFWDDVNAVAVADVNGDGKPDLLVAVGSTPEYDNGSVFVLLNNGDGTFGVPTGYLSGGYAWSIAVADLNGDGKPDLVVGNIIDSMAAVLLGNGDGTFQPALTYNSGGQYANSVAVADVNGDGKPDLVVADEGATSGPNGALSVLLGNGDGTFQAPLIYNSTGFLPMGLVLADVNGDGRPDILSTTGALSPPPSSVGVWLNNNGPHTPTTTTVNSSENPVLMNEPVTYTARIAGEHGIALSGTVIFQDGATTIATVALSGNRATYTTSYTNKAVGFHSITASYSGDLHNSPSTSATLTEDVVAVPVVSTTTLTTSGSPSFVGQPVTLTATVTWKYGTAPNGGLVTFYEGTRTLGSIALAGGLASYKTSSLTLGTHFIKATYSGDATFRPSSGTVTQVIDGYPTSTTLISSLNPSIYGQTVTWTVRTTTSGAITPTGEVSLKGGGYAFGPITLNASGVATLTKSMLNVDSYPLAAVYAGNATYAGSTSAILTQVVTQAKSFATLTSSPNPSTQGQAVTFTATISSPTVRATGPVTFAAGTTVLGTAQLSGGKAKFTTSTLAVGSSTVKATYYGDSNIAESSASVKQTVQP